MSTIFDGEIVCVDRGGHWQFDCSFPQSVILVVPAASCLGNALHCRSSRSSGSRTSAVEIAGPDHYARLYPRCGSAG